MPVEVKKVDPKGQISLGKRYAGRSVSVEQLEDGVWRVTAIPKNELWLHTPEMRASLDRALA
jgi:hypothetical protein